MSVLLDAFVVTTALAHVWLTPFTKVEESFNLHATHDVLMYGVGPSNLSNYDHNTFPGAVPRSFVGSVVLAWTTLPIVHLLNRFDAILSKADILFCVRTALAAFNALGLCYVRRAVSKRFGFLTGAFFVALTCSQFHLPFWMGRTLPNMFALLPVSIAYGCLLSRMPNSARPSERKVSIAVSLLTFTAVVFRAELALLLAPFALQALLARWISLGGLLKTGIVAGLFSMALTIAVDSYFWNELIWPELNSLYFNVYEGKSADWGVSPFHAYLSSHLPKLLLSAAPLSAFGFISDSRIRTLLVSPIAFVLLISLLGHKEWRFVVYTIPLFNVAGARGLYWLSRQRTGTVFGKLCILFTFGCLISNVLVSYTMTQASMANYPGGGALTRFNWLYRDSSAVHVHIDNLAAQTGASLFLHIHAPPFPPFLSRPSQTDWVYNKTENLSPKDITKSSHFTHAITEHAKEFPSKEWKVAECIQGFDGIRLNRRRIGVDVGSKGFGISLPFPEFTYAEKLCILERK